MTTKLGRTGDTFRRQAVCVLVAVLTSFGSTLLNNTVIPLFTLRYPADRDAVYLVSLIATYAFIAWASRKAPRMLNPRVHGTAMCICLIVGTLLFVTLGEAEPPPRIPMDIAFALLLVGRNWAFAGYAAMLCELHDLRTAIVCVTLPSVTDQVIVALSASLGWSGRVMLTGVLPIVVLALVLPSYARNVRRLQEQVSIDDLILRQPRSFATLGNLIFINMLVFRLIFGFALAWNLESDTGIPINTWAVAPLAAVVAVAMLVHSKKTEPAGVPNHTGEGLREDVLLKMASFWIIAGFTLALLSFSVDTGLAATVAIRIGELCARILVMLSLVSLGMRNTLQALFVFSCGRAFEVTGLEVGTHMGHVVNAYTAAGNFSVASAIIAAMLVAFAAYCVFVLWNFSYAAVIYQTTPVRELEGAWVEDSCETATDEVALDERRTFLAADSPDPNENSSRVPVDQTGSSDIDLIRAGSEAFDKRCEEFARSSRLTPRESEILILLARGRDGRYISEDLGISYNTVKTHVKRIYTKLGIHSQQELIDLVS